MARGMSMTCVKVSIDYNEGTEITFSQYVKEVNGLVDIKDIQGVITSLVDQVILDGKIRGHIVADGTESWDVYSSSGTKVYTIEDAPRAINGRVGESLSHRK